MTEIKPANIKLPLFLLAFLIIAAISCIIFIPYKQALVFEYENTGKILAYIPFNEEKLLKLVIPIPFISQMLWKATR